MLTVHHLGISQSERIVWLCEELGIAYQLKRYDRRADNQAAPDDYKALHPMGIAPVISDGDVVLAESGAITDYIVARYGDGRLVPHKDSPDFADHLFWFHFANGTFMATIMIELMVGVANGGDNPQMGFIADRKARAWAMIEKRLGECEYFGGSELTTADIMMGFGLTTMRMFSGEAIGDFPNTRAYLKRIGDRPAFQRAMAKAEPGMAPKLD